MKKQVLVVDDDISILIAVRELLHDRGYEVITAESGSECLAELKLGFQGVVLMDVMMPNMDGWETIKSIVEQGLMDNIVISMLTAKDVPDEPMDEVKEYIVDYITKPFEPDQFIQTIDNFFSYLEKQL